MQNFLSQHFELIGEHGHWKVWSDGRVCIKQPKCDHNLIDHNLDIYNRIKQIAPHLTLEVLEPCLFDGELALCATLLTEYVSPNSVDPNPDRTVVLCQIQEKQAPQFCELEQQFYDRKVGEIINESEMLSAARADMEMFAQHGLEFFGDAFFFRASATPYKIDYLIADWDNIYYRPNESEEYLRENNIKELESEFERFKQLFCL